jgi:hypothetical protein
MKPMKSKILLCILVLCFSGPDGFAQEEKPQLSLAVSYTATNHKVPYLRLQTQVRKDKTIEAVSGVLVKVFLNEVSEATQAGQVTTNEKGIGYLVLPPSLKESWAASPKHIFIAKVEESKAFAEASTELEITKGRIRIDTLMEEGVRNIIASFLEFDGKDWLPANEVELKIGVRRQGGILPVGEEESYTTDSTGQATAEFKRDSLPGDSRGNLVVVVRTEDHELYGSVVEEKTLPWGVVANTKNNLLGKRTLWSTGDKVPFWLLAISISIIVGVWSVIVYLVVQIIRLRKLGKNAAEEDEKPANPVPVLSNKEEFAGS